MIAVSGGADSLALLFAASAVQHAIKRELVVAHFSHGIRKTAELREATLVKRVAKGLGLTVVHERSSVAPSESAAREARYAFLARASRSVDVAAVLTAHTRDDQAETLLLRLTRGSGLRGAGAIRELSVREVEGSELTLLRPLLSITRAETVATCVEHSVTPASDGSNRSLRYARNRMRHRVLRELEEVNPSAREALSRFAAAAQEDDDLLQSMANDAVEDFEKRSGGLVAWPVGSLRKLPNPLVVRVLQRGWVSIAGAGAALSQQQIGASVALVQRTEGGALDLGGGIRLVVDQDRIKLTRHADAPSLPPT
ncbi:MAG: tRNA lysidine(34) synthetase TilS, partial [Chloroflexi bacterium]|nr:tRNA lysidine(34) synthetase TilS [Chloroflexota bacterium]